MSQSDKPQPSPASEGAPEDAEKTRPPRKDDEVAIRPLPERVGEPPDNLERRDEWFRKRRGRD
jgi:hypothetical protein